MYTYIYIWYPPPVTYPFSPCLKSLSCTASKLGVQYSVFLGRRLKYNKNRIHGTVEKPKIPKPKKQKNKTKKKNQNNQSQKNLKNQNQKNQKYQKQQFSGTLRNPYGASPRVPEIFFFFFFFFFFFLGGFFGFCFFWFFFLFWYFWLFGFGILAFWFAFTVTRQQLHIFQCAYANCAFQK